MWGYVRRCGVRALGAVVTDEVLEEMHNLGSIRGRIRVRGRVRGRVSVTMLSPGGPMIIHIVLRMTC